MVTNRLSSRPWNAFEVEFGQEKEYVLQLHEHTYDDIRLCIRGVLEEDPIFRDLEANDPRYQEVVTELVQKAKGVCLRVFLVVRDLSNSLPNADTVAEFSRRVKEFPPDLEPYFQRVLESIPAFYQTQCSQILLIALAAEEPLHVTALYHLLEGHSDVS